MGQLDLYNNNIIIYPYKKAIAQYVIVKNYKIKQEEISENELDKIPSKRGKNKLGESGK